MTVNTQESPFFSVLVNFPQGKSSYPVALPAHFNGKVGDVLQENQNGQIEGNQRGITFGSTYTIDEDATPRFIEGRIVMFVLDVSARSTYAPEASNANVLLEQTVDLLTKKVQELEEKVRLSLKVTRPQTNSQNLPTGFPEKLNDDIVVGEAEKLLGTDADGKFVLRSPHEVGEDQATDITISRTASTVVVNSTTGENGTIEAVDSQYAGIVTPAQRAKWNNNPQANLAENNKDESDYVKYVSERSKAGGFSVGSTNNVPGTVAFWDSSNSNLDDSGANVSDISRMGFHNEAAYDSNGNPTDGSLPGVTYTDLFSAIDPVVEGSVICLQAHGTSTQTAIFTVTQVHSSTVFSVSLQWAGGSPVSDDWTDHWVTATVVPAPLPLPHAGEGLTLIGGGIGVRAAFQSALNLISEAFKAKVQGRNEEQVLTGNFKFGVYISGADTERVQFTMTGSPSKVTGLYLRTTSNANNAIINAHLNVHTRILIEWGTVGVLLELTANSSTKVLQSHNYTDVKEVERIGGWDGTLPASGSVVKLIQFAGEDVHREELAEVAFSGSYDDLVDKPSGGGGQPGVSNVWYSLKRKYVASTIGNDVQDEFLLDKEGSATNNVVMRDGETVNVANLLFFIIEDGGSDASERDYVNYATKIGSKVSIIREGTDRVLTATINHVLLNAGGVTGQTKFYYTADADLSTGTNNRDTAPYLGYVGDETGKTALTINFNSPGVAQADIYPALEEVADSFYNPLATLTGSSIDTVSGLFKKISGFSLSSNRFVNYPFVIPGSWAAGKTITASISTQVQYSGSVGYYRMRMDIRKVRNGTAQLSTVTLYGPNKVRVSQTGAPNSLDVSNFTVVDSSGQLGGQTGSQYKVYAGDTIALQTRYAAPSSGNQSIWAYSEGDTYATGGLTIVIN